jgi:hypothetical protein
MSSEAVKSHDPKSLSSLFQSVWPATLLVLGLGATVAWTSLLGYGLVKLAEMAL